ncbi:Tetraspanin-2 [Xyrichtys novacula]|uniref:Tetraspanin-2 n=1 Tax=Xyrichtys novacula TaxID=13765 RepID=A0AAV1ENE0_XYRNO|nr:Tetraspanin-2 [Xyrichtys novacula]
MSKVQGGMKCVKYLLFVFNFIFWLSGLLVLAVGLWLRFDPKTVELLMGDGAPDTFFIAVYILLGAGGLMMIVGFFGCFGAVRESQCLLASLNCCGGSVSETTSALCADSPPEETQDCITAITEFFNERLHIIGYIGIGIAGVMILGMVFSMVLCCAIRNNREVI